MNANTIVHNLQQMRKEAIAASNLTEVVLEGLTSKALETITQAGGTKLHSEWETWCHSAGQTCQCNSHSPGQDYTTVIVPETWLITDDVDEPHALFEMSQVETDHIHPIMIVPTDQPTLIYRDSHGRHYADTTRAATAREWKLNENR